MTSLLPALLRLPRRQHARLIETSLARAPHPSGASRAHAPGIDPDRVLVIGGGDPAVGAGVTCQDLAVAGHLARAVSGRTSRGADVDVLADPSWDIDAVARHLGERDLRGYDAVVIAVGGSDAFRFLPEQRWAASLRRLLARVSRLSAPHTPVVVVGIQPPSSLPAYRTRAAALSDTWAERLNAVTRRICSLDARARYVAPPVEVEASLASHRFFEWGVVVATSLAPLLDDVAEGDRLARAARNRPQAEERRLATLWELRLVDTPAERRFDEIVGRARTLFGTGGAAFSVIDEDRQWNKAVAGVDIREVPLDRSFCATTVSRAEPFVVGDARSDPRAAHLDSDWHFYAGYPVEAADGTRVGALCVFDREPRDADSVDLRLLRDFALAIQRELRAVPV
ncbi:hypothetical protein AS850_12325 [Frondihabitans sp. 762G35]|uniref:GDSL-type esterase/lipase family protein n=1 Tax=Frondihabitans sp. 762G35 TaxID=1446794 RepID=UPI000D225AE0|nr:GDSL-type esterase/lipase family protein [Frondihabitans sp. 762G35]ARC57861.1 hypothetical protein AS850_12325 [Frondihabitans sp. 762G35]